MKIFSLSLLAGLCLTVGQTAFAQTLSNTGSTITLTGSCMLTSNGAYTLNLAYVDPDNGYTAMPATPATVSSGGGVVTITVGVTLPTPSSNGYWSLPDADNGVISLTNGPTPSIIFWYHNPFGSLQFNCVPLPIYFNNFTGTQSGSYVDLSWRTEMEQNTTVIEIYRSSTGTNFYKIGEVPAADNSSIIVNYSFTDHNPDADNYYYLKMLNYDGMPAITSNTIHVSCAGCTYTPPEPVECDLTINGPDHICELGTRTAYSLSGPVPDYSTITWSADPPSAVSLTTYPDFDRTRVTLLKKDVAAGIVLKATISGCANEIAMIIAMGTPDPDLSTPVHCPWATALARNSPGATDYEWHLQDQTVGGETITHSQSPFFGPDISGGHIWAISVRYTNGCGVSAFDYSYGLTCRRGFPGFPGSVVKLSPNPSSGVVSIGLAPASETAITGAAAGAGKYPDASAMAAGKPKVYQVKVVDASGNVRKTFSYSGGVDNVSVNLSGLINGVYTVQVYDGKTWSSNQVVLTK